MLTSLGTPQCGQAALHDPLASSGQPSTFNCRLSTSVLVARFRYVRYLARVG